jgi:hypothetical protein
MTYQIIRVAMHGQATATSLTTAPPRSSGIYGRCFIRPRPQAAAPTHANPCTTCSFGTHYAGHHHRLASGLIWAKRAGTRTWC